MCKLLDNDIFLGNLFVKLIEKEKMEIEFKKIFDYVYYVSKKLNEKQDTVILVTRDKLEFFINKYCDYIHVTENEKMICIKNKELALRCFMQRYGAYVGEFEKELDEVLSA